MVRLCSSLTTPKVGIKVKENKVASKVGRERFIVPELARARWGDPELVDFCFRMPPYRVPPPPYSFY